MSEKIHDIDGIRTDQEHEFWASIKAASPNSTAEDTAQPEESPAASHFKTDFSHSAAEIAVGSIDALPTPSLQLRTINIIRAALEQKKRQILADNPELLADE